MPKRSAGVTFGAVILFLQATPPLLLVVFGLIGGVLAKDASGRSAGWMVAGIFGALTLGLILLAVGALRLRRWARLWLLGLSWCNLPMGTTILPILWAMARTNDPKLQAGLPWFAGWVGLLQVALPLWWIWLLSRAGVKAQFSGVAELPPDMSAGSPTPGRPLSVTVIACLLMYSGLMTLVLPAWQRPMPWLFGLQVSASVMLAYMIVLGLIALISGVGVWRLRPWAWRSAMAYLVVAGLQALAVLAMPQELWQTTFRQASAKTPGATLDPAIVTMMPASIALLGGLGSLIQIGFLFRLRYKFSKSARNPREIPKSRDTLR